MLATAAALALPALHVRASRPRGMAPMADGPFYPPLSWRSGGPLAGDWDADLTRVQRAGSVRVARGEHLGLELVVADAEGRPIDGAAVEIWQCDAMAQYRHPRVTLQDGAWDDGCQGFGEARSGRDGSLALRTIRLVPYPGRTPHIHVKLRHASFGEFTFAMYPRASSRKLQGDRTHAPTVNPPVHRETSAVPEAPLWPAMCRRTTRSTCSELPLVPVRLRD